MSLRNSLHSLTLSSWLCFLFLLLAARNTQAQPLTASLHQGDPPARIGFRLQGTILEVLERNPDSNNLEPVARVRLTGPLLAFVQYGNRLFIARGWKGVLALDISTLRKPRMLGPMSVGGYAAGLSLRGQELVIDLGPDRSEQTTLKLPPPVAIGNELPINGDRKNDPLPSQAPVSKVSVLPDFEQPPSHLPPLFKVPPPGRWTSLLSVGGFFTVSGIALTVCGIVFLPELKGSGDHQLLGALVGAGCFVPGVVLVASGGAMLGVGRAKVRSYQNELEEASKDPRRYTEVVARIRQSMVFDKIGTSVTGALAGLGIVMAAIGYPLWFSMPSGVDTEQTRAGRWVAISGSVLSTALFPFIGFVSSYARERALLSRQGALRSAPAEVTLTPLLSLGTYGLSLTGRY